jgi:hypothetical protein
MNREFKSKRAALWLGGVAVLVLGFIVAAVALPSTAKTPTGPDIHVPRMQNVPPEHGPKMKLDVEKKSGDAE